jgi:hypothetical protein
VLVTAGAAYWAAYAAIVYAVFSVERRQPRETRHGFGVGGKVGATNVELADS